MSNSKSNWRDASPAHPCQVCEAVKWCSETADGAVIHCRKAAECPKYGKGRPKTGKSGDYYEFFTRPRVDANPPTRSHTEGGKR